MHVTTCQTHQIHTHDSGFHSQHNLLSHPLDAQAFPWENPDPSVATSPISLNLLWKVSFTFLLTPKPGPWAGAASVVLSYGRCFLSSFLGMIGSRHGDSSLLLIAAFSPSPSTFLKILAALMLLISDSTVWTPLCCCTSEISLVILFHSLNVFIS